ncbi:sensor histidine kinase [Kordiimonas sp. SCSIO 12610]|uniref:sensor histidine kinase n=1 Tax=Kordiimonas sp. SCSIO 12610 TaxID=2829597 RepID=UPI00210B88FB|nr:sensor histidine kinase [Kordiimonas sp. SCSIO 12610]UTW56361.1 sensor histidine kinase [Kordiimonas sp. SCSIO 12610]
MIRNLIHFLRTVTGRLLLVAVMGSAVALSVGGITLSRAFSDYLLSDVDARLVRQLDLLIGASQLNRDGTLEFVRPIVDEQFTKPYSGLYWQISSVSKRPKRSRSLWDFELSPDMSSQVFVPVYAEIIGPNDQQLRTIEVDIILPEDTESNIYRYTVAINMADLKVASVRFNQLLLVALGAIMLFVVATYIFQIAYGLLPLRRLSKALSDVTAGDKLYLEGEWPEDLDPIAEEVNTLIDKNQKLVDRARTHVGNLAHALKTPLSVIQNEVAGDTSEQAKVIINNTRIIRDHVDHHLKRARIAGAMGGPGVDIKERIEKLIRAISTMYESKLLDFSFECADGLRFDGEREDFDEVMGNIIENAGKWAHSCVKVTVTPVQTARRNRKTIEIKIEDDGPGVPKEKMQSIFERGKRLDEQVPGTGLGLSIVRDIAEMYEGHASLDTSNMGGLAVILRLPYKEMIG